MIITIAPPAPQERRARPVFGQEAVPPPVKAPYRDPTDEPCRPGPPLFVGGPPVPAWVGSYMATSVETEYPDWAPSLTQRADLAALGLPEAATWWEAKTRIARAKKRKTA